MRVNDTEKIEMILDLMGESYSEKLERSISAYLKSAGKEILNWRYGYSSEIPGTVPKEYEMTQIHAVIAGYSISGAEGQTQHSENGINRSFRYPDMLAYIRSNVIPYAGVL